MYHTTKRKVMQSINKSFPVSFSATRRDIRETLMFTGFERPAGLGPELLAVRFCGENPLFLRVCLQVNTVQQRFQVDTDLSG
jgi:hypothetical protein